MKINFDYINEFGLSRNISTEVEPITLTKENCNSKLSYCPIIFERWRNEWDILGRLFCETFLNNISAKDWTIEGTVKQMDYFFLEAVTKEELKARIKYKFKLNEKGLELFEILKSYWLITEENKQEVTPYIQARLDLLLNNWLKY